MKKGPNQIDNWESIKNILADTDKSWDLRGTLADNEEIMHKKFSRLSQDYRNTINQESESDYVISEKDVYEAKISDIEKKFNKNSTEYKIFQVLKSKWLKIFINPKTDISFTSWYNMIRWRWPITEQSKYTMGLWSDASDEELYMTKLVHEMWHSLATYIPDNMDKLFRHIIILRNLGCLTTNLWNLDRYKSLQEKATEDTIEFVRMYIQNPENFKMHLKTVLGANNTQAQEYYYKRTKEFVDIVLSRLDSGVNKKISTHSS